MFEALKENIDLWSHKQPSLNDNEDGTKASPSLEDLAQQEDLIAKEEKELTLEEEIALFMKREIGLEKNYYERNLALSKFMNALKRLDKTVLRETEMLESHNLSNFNDINAQKTRGLYELNLALDALNLLKTPELETYMSRALEVLKVDLERNNELLQMHLEAVSELTAMLQAAFQANETDGTYGPHGGHNRDNEKFEC